MGRSVRLCRVDELSLGQARRFEVEGVSICVVCCADGVHAVNDVCSHEDFSLAEGEVDTESCEIECWKHGSLFSLLTGDPQTLPATRPIEVYEVSIEEGSIAVVLP